MKIEKAVLVGNSAGGGVAVAAALAYPERVQALVLVDPAISGGNPIGSGSALNITGLLNWLLYNTPQGNRLGPVAVRSISGTQGDETIRRAWHDPTKISPETYAGYRKPLQMNNWDRALWEYTRAARPVDLWSQVVSLRMPVLIVTGDDDRIIPAERSIQLAGQIAGSQLMVFNQCGHVPHEECPQDFIKAVEPFLQKVVINQ